MRERIGDLFSAIDFISPEGSTIPTAEEFAAVLNEGVHYFPQRIVFASGVGFGAAAGLYAHGLQDKRKLTIPVVELELDLVTAQLHCSPTDPTYQTKVIGGLWELVRTWGQAVPEAGAYLTPYDGSGDLIDLLFGAGKAEQRWWFDLALVSHPVAQHFAPVPRTFQRAALPEGIGLARTASWPVMPWEAQVADSEARETALQGTLARGSGHRHRSRWENLRT